MLWVRQIEKPYPRGAMRLYPSTDRRLGSESLMSWAEIEKFAKGKVDIFLNVFSEDQKKRGIYDCIFLDIDSPDLQEAFIRTMKICSELTARGILYYHVVYSGAKGFHIYVPIKDVQLQDYRKAVQGWLRSFDLIKYVDMQVVESNRVSRLVGTINSKSGKYCIYLGNAAMMEGLSFEEIRKLVEAGRSSRIGGWLVNDVDLKKFDGKKFVAAEVDGEIKGKSVLWRSMATYPKCMEELVMKAFRGVHLGHIERLEMGKFLLHLYNNDVGKAAKMYEQMANFDLGKSRYHLEYILKRRLKVSGCDKMLGYGVCPFEDKEAQKECEYFPSINKYVKIDRMKRL